VIRTRFRCTMFGGRRAECVAAGFLWGFSRPAYQYDGNFVASDYIDRGGAGARRAHADNGQTASAARLMHSDCQFVYSARPSREFSQPIPDCLWGSRSRPEIVTCGDRRSPAARHDHGRVASSALPDLRPASRLADTARPRIVVQSHRTSRPHDKAIRLRQSSTPKSSTPPCPVFAYVP
jgi:hypothetical protein